MATSVEMTTTSDMSMSSTSACVCSSSVHPRAPHHRRSARRADRKIAAARLNDVGASLIDHDDPRHAIEVLRDAVEVLTARKESGPYSSSPHGGYSFEVAKAEARLSKAKRAKKSSKRSRRARRDNNNNESDKDESSSSACAFSYADSIKMSSMIPIVDEVPVRVSVGSQGLLAVILYNLALAHNVSGFHSGKESLVEKASSLYKMSESVLLQQANDDPESLNGVDVTYLARAIVNNMGMILYEWGKPDAGREYFDGLTSISFDNELNNNDSGEESVPARRSRRGGRWNAFEVNALIARGVISSPAA